MTMSTLKTTLVFLLTAALAATPLVAAVSDCWMTGGGSIFDTVQVDFTGRTTHGFEIHCDGRNPNNLQVNWAENRFHLDDMQSAFCFDAPDISPNPPGALFDTFQGVGTGRLNGVRGGGRISWTFTDAGEGGSGDFARITIIDTATDAVVLDVEGFLTFGNHQAHSN